MGLKLLRFVENVASKILELTIIVAIYYLIFISVVDAIVRQ